MSTTEQRTRAADDSVGVLVSRASQQISDLVRQEMELARVEMTQKGKRFGIGGAQAAVVAGIAALALVLPVWASALIATGVLAAVAALVAVSGKKQIGKAGAPTPEQTVRSVKADVAEIREKARR
ncbi:phage holin family protein [Streptomyces sp. NPDC101733]|uniref:phage holin family protein n=1 Tax=unclassified Streptomyces TaxID=2593676 RepID=UPI0037F938D8